MKLNKNFRNLQDSYLFATIANRLSEYLAAHPDAPVIKMGIGDVTLPLPQVCVQAMEEASREMGVKETFKGYGDYPGYPFLREAVRGYYRSYGVELKANDVFISDGAKNDVANILDLFAQENTVLVPDPVYPVYVDTNVMAGRKVVYINGNAENGFTPSPDPSIDADIIYICSPNNPTGAVYTKEGLKEWVDYANERQALILFDAAYEAFIEDPAYPHSIYEVEGARTCAIEICSLSKTAGFTGTRCGYTVIPEELERDGESLNRLWLRRQSTKHNGVSYIIQRGAAAVFTPEGLAQCRENIAYYKENTRMLAKVLDEKGIFYTGGKNSPYVWLKAPGGKKSWEFFDMLLNDFNIVGTPGSGFGENGESYFRLTGFGSREQTEIAVDRLRKLL